jgi:predicted secreted protein
MESVPTTIQLKVGETCTLRLKGRASAGYMWEHHLVGSVHALNVTQVALPVHAPGDADDRLPTSNSADVLLSLLAVEPGRVTLHLHLRRPWETDRLPLLVYSSEITIMPALP